jgi:adenosine deaminase
METMKIEELQQLPKIDLHCHLDGSVPLPAMSRILGRKISPQEVQVSENCRDLAEYLAKFDVPLQCVQTEEGLRLAAREFLLEVAKENICYVEARFAPLSSVHEGLSTRQVIEAVLEGLKEAYAICGVSYNVIACAMRHQPDEENLAMFRTCREYLGEGICAVDLAGNEAAFPMKNFRELFAQAGKLELPFTIHAGECGSVQNVREAVDCGAARIGHGIALQGHPEEIRYCLEKGVGLELCPISNLQTKAASRDHYPLREFLDAGLKVTLNTDNRTVSRTSMTREMEFVQEAYGISDEELLLVMKHAVEISFADDATKQKLWNRFGFH